MLDSFSPTLAHTWTPDVDPTGWLMSEKLDGMRAIWDGAVLRSRTNKPIYADPELLSQLPKCKWLDGELFLGRGRFQECMSIVRRKQADERWSDVTYQVFDAPMAGGNYQQRMAGVLPLIEGKSRVRLVQSVVCEGMEHLMLFLDRLTAHNAEGVMLRDPGAVGYKQKRSHNLLKVKKFNDDEALVIEHQEGAGRHENRLGALLCVLRSGKMVKIGSGFTDAQRENPPGIGEVVAFKYFELTRDGIPRFPTFKGVRHDVHRSEFGTP